MLRPFDSMRRSPLSLLLCAALLLAILVGSLLLLQPEQPPAASRSDEGNVAAPSPGKPARPSPSSPSPRPYSSGMRPGEVAPGSHPDTVLVQPLAPDEPKEISRHYRATSPEEDPRIDRTGNGALIFQEAIALANRLHDPRTPPESDLEILEAILGFYRMIYRQNPVAASNAAVVRNLTGENPQRVVVFPRSHPSLSGNGELLDRWGTPYFFHALSRDAMEIWSAGPDSRFGSEDDIRPTLDMPELQLRRGDER